jgi:hypothetical protein
MSYTEKLRERTEKVHDAGANRHPQYWFSANRAAVEVLWELGLDPANSLYKYLVSKVVLKVLDVCFA